jgi:hypothetical protein
MQVYLRRDTVEALHAIEGVLGELVGASIGHAGKKFLIHCALAFATA